MANAKLSVLSAAMNTATAATVATAIGNGIVASDITALIDLLKTLSLRPDLAIPAMKLSPVGLGATYLSPG